MPLVLLPGLDGTGKLFRPLLAALPGWIIPVVVTYPPDRQLDYDQLLPIVLNALPTTEPFILLGESFSGPLAIRVAAQPPNHLLGVILCATFATSPMSFISPLLRLFARPMVYRLFPATQRVNALLGEYASVELRRLIDEVHAEISPAVIAFRMRFVLRVDVREQLKLSTVPMLCLAGEKDVVVPRRNRRLIEKIRPDVQTVTINAPHGLLQSRPTEAAAAISNFSRSLTRQTRFESNGTVTSDSQTTDKVRVPGSNGDVNTSPA